MSEPEPMQQRPKKNTHTHLWRCRCLHGAHKRKKEKRLLSRQCSLSLSLHPRNPTTTTLVRRACCCRSSSLHLCARSSVSLCLRKRRRHASSRAPRCVVVVGGASRPGSDRTRPARRWASPSTGHRVGGGGAGRASRRACVNQTQHGNPKPI